MTTTYSDDPDAKWTIKAGRPYYGYKLHMATDAQNGFIIGGHLTSANRADTKELMEVVTESKAPSGCMVFSDKGYASIDNRCDLEENQITDGIMYKAVRGRQLSESEKMVNRMISGIRGIVERGFGTLKKDYRFQRTRYLGCAKVKLECNGLQPQKGGDYGPVVRPRDQNAPNRAEIAQKKAKKVTKATKK